MYELFPTILEEDEELEFSVEGHAHIIDPEPIRLLPEVTVEEILNNIEVVPSIEEDIETLANQAKCNDGKGNLVKIFFSENPDDIARAKKYCAVCPIKRECLEGAIERREPWGVWGGKLFIGGKPTDNAKP